jgi:phage gp16-like protein
VRAPAGERRVTHSGFHRRQKLAALHAAAKRLGLDDETYRDRLERATGMRSAAALDDAGLDTALAEFRRGLRAKGGESLPHHAKVKALWIAAYNLGCLERGDDPMLDAFAKRQTGKDRLVFVTPVEANAITEALKAILRRHGFEVPANDPGGMKARIALVLAQWKKIHEFGTVRIADEGAIMHWAHGRNIIGCSKLVQQWKRHELDLAAKNLGAWLRGAQKRQGTKHAS